MVHRLVCAAFHGDPPAVTDHADHIDFDTRNNRASNLRWLPASLNGGRKVTHDGRGWVRPDEQDPPDGYRPLTASELAQLDAAIAMKGW